MIGIIVFCLFPWEGFGYTKITKDDLNLESIFFGVTRFVFFILQIYLVIRLLNPKKPKLTFTNLDRGFHPIFIDENGKSELDNYFAFGLCFLGIVVFYTYYETFDFRLVIESIAIICAALILLRRNQILNSFPIEFIKRNDIRFIVKYEDYLNHKIADDEPHIKVNQFLMPIKKEYPRNLDEENTIEIRNHETPNTPALVTKIIDGGLLSAINDGYELKVRVVDIKRFGELEIELRLHK